MYSYDFLVCILLIMEGCCRLCVFKLGLRKGVAIEVNSTDNYPIGSYIPLLWTMVLIKSIPIDSPKGLVAIGKVGCLFFCMY